MQAGLQRLQKKNQGDGPAERQVLLLKLMHEFENAPLFGTSYIANADSDAQRWIARVGALLTRMGIEKKLKFQMSRDNAASYWSVTRENLRRQILWATEEIKLELEMDGHEDIGKVYDAKQQYDFLRDLSEVIQGAEEDLIIVDPYFDGQAFDTYISPVLNDVKVKILCSKSAVDVAGRLTAYKGQNSCDIEIRKSRDLHDRLIIIDQSDCWVVGGSIKDAGKKPTYLLPLQPGISPSKIKIYNGLWDDSQTI